MVEPKAKKKFPYADDAADAQLSSLPVDEQAGDDDSYDDDDNAVACAADDEIKISEKDSIFFVFSVYRGEKVKLLKKWIR